MNLPETILVIDDEVQIRRLLEITLSSNGFKISEATTGKEGLIAAATQHPSLIILDLGLPDTDGIEILKKISVFHELGFPVLAGPSHKSFIGKVTGHEAKDRRFGTAACVAACVEGGVQILRVHEAGAMRDVILMTEAIKGDSSYVRTFEMGKYQA